MTPPTVARAAWRVGRIDHTSPLVLSLRLGAPDDSPLGQLIIDPLGAVSRWWGLAEHIVIAHLPSVLIVAVTLVVPILALHRLIISWRHTRLAEGARVIRIQAPPTVEAAAAATLWANLIGLIRPRWRRLIFGQPHVAFEYLWDGPHLHIQIWIPGCVPASLVARAVEAAWPAARTTIIESKALIPEGAAVTGGTLRLARPDHYPIAHDHGIDPIRALLGAASGNNHGQVSVVQILARPVTGRRLAQAHQAAAVLRGAHRPTLIGRLLDLITPEMSTRPARTGAVAAAHPERAGEIRAILSKAAAPRLEVAVRYAAATTHTTDPDATRAWLRGRAHAIASTFAVFSGRNHFDRHRLRLAARTLAERRMRHGDLLSVDELAALAHLPHDAAVPGLARAGARSVPPPPQVASDGPGSKLLGDADAGPPRSIALRVPDARHHLHVIGATGAGKSTLLAHLVLADAAAGRSAVVIDPRGDLINDLLDRLPEEATERVWLIDPDTAPPPALGVLSGHSGTDANVISDNLVGIFQRVFADNWGPRTDDILRSAVLTLQQTPGTTLADVPRLLTDEPFRTRATGLLHDEILVGFWNWYSGLSPEARSAAIGPVMNKLRHFLLRPFVRAVVGTPGPGLNIGRLLNTGALLLVRIPKGTLGNDTSRLIGSFVVAKVWEAITARARQPEATRRDAAFYIDEAHSFLNLPRDIEDMLAEARAYRLCVGLAHQDLAQLPVSMRDMVAANARNKIYFAVSARDARELSHVTQPNLTEHDLANLGAYQAAIRLVTGAEQSSAFTLTTRPLPPPHPGRADAARQAARAHAETTRRPPPLPDPRRHDTPAPSSDSADGPHDSDDDPAPSTRPPT